LASFPTGHLFCHLYSFQSTKAKMSPAVPDTQAAIPAAAPTVETVKAQEPVRIQTDEVKADSPIEAQAEEPKAEEQAQVATEEVKPVEEKKEEHPSIVSPPTPEIKDAASAAIVEQTRQDGTESVQNPGLGTLTAQLAAELPFDADKIKEKYLAERDKRLREDGNDQYKEFKGQFAHYLTDPYTPRVERDPIECETDFLVLGGGFGGLCLGAELAKQGIKNFKMIDKAGDFGGTWYWNRYPGAACDIGKLVAY
jgi:hypothetical protein